ncbi:MAG TPA: xylulokinase [Clostridiales bacterium]|nr:xylulokinase [Clostridiales bacterium]
MSFFMGIDLGTSGVKVVVIDQNGQVVGTGSEELTLDTPGPNWAEQHPNQWWSATCSAIKAALADGGDIGNKIEGIGLSGQMLGATFLDKNLDVIRPCIIWCDQRSSEERDFIEESIGMEHLLELTANYPLTGYVAPKILWLRKNEPEAYERVHKVLLPKDYLRLKLTGELAAEVSDAGGTYLFDVKNREWSSEMLEKLDIPGDFLPDVYESVAVTGQLRKDVAEELGLREGIPVVGGGGDQTAGGVGNGVVDEGIVSSTIGTSGVVFACVNKPQIDTKGRGIHTFCHSVEDKWAVFGCTLAAGGSYKWLRDKFSVVEKEFARLRGMDTYDVMDLSAGKAQPGCGGLLFAPYLIGERTPYPDPDARGLFFGLTLRHGWPEIVRSVMEGVTFSLRDSLEILREFGVNVKQVRASGGGAKSPLWRQMQADIFNTEVITTNVEEGPAVGAAIMSAVGSGYYSTVQEACKKIIKPLSKTEPIKENVELYEDLYGIYKSLYPTLKDTFKKEAEIMKKWSL